MSVGFGFSIGDLIAVGNLALQVVQALRESGGAKDDYESLCELLLSLSRSIQAASDIFLLACLASNEGSVIDIAPLNGIRHELECCKRLMENFMTSSVKYTEAFSNGGGRWFQKQCKKVTWSLYKVDDVRKLQISLQGHFGAFQLYTSALIRQSLVRTEKRIADGTEMGLKILSSVKEMTTILKALQEDIPKNIGYQWEGGWTDDEKPIRFEDALGRVVMLPILLCGSYDVFHGVLKIMFKDLPGQEKIALEEYRIIEDSEGATIQGSNWQSKISPGTRISMSIFVRGQSKNTVEHCPRCNKTCARTKLKDGQYRCSFCHLIFRRFWEERFVELEDTPETENTVSSDSNSTVLQITQTNKQEGGGRVVREEDAFRRIHYFWETPRSKTAFRSLPGYLGKENHRGRFDCFPDCLYERRDNPPDCVHRYFDERAFSQRASLLVHLRNAHRQNIPRNVFTRLLYSHIN